MTLVKKPRILKANKFETSHVCVIAFVKMFVVSVMAIAGGCAQLDRSHPISTTENDRIASSSRDVWQGYSRLSNKEIIDAFKDVVDNATVVDGAGGVAKNVWYQDGRFTSNWVVGEKSGRLTGRWFVRDNLRCVTFDVELDGFAAGDNRCGPIYFKDGKYFSSNKMGTMHGVHTLTNLNSGAHRPDDE